MIISRADKAFNERLLKEAQARRRMGAGSLSDELNFEIRVNKDMPVRLFGRMIARPAYRKRRKSSDYSGGTQLKSLPD